MPDIRERWRTSLIEATAYDWAVEHEHVAGLLGRLIWGTDTAAFYRDIARLAELPAGTSVLDIPCGGGVAFRGLRPGPELHYVAADLSPVMLRAPAPRPSAVAFTGSSSSRRTWRPCRSRTAASTWS